MITVQYPDFNKVIGKAQIDLGLGVCMTLAPKEEKTQVEGKDVITKYIEFTYMDERINYSYTFKMYKDEYRRFTALINTLNAQLTLQPADDNNNGTGDASCSRKVNIK